MKMSIIQKIQENRIDSVSCILYVYLYADPVPDNFVNIQNENEINVSLNPSKMLNHIIEILLLVFSVLKCTTQDIEYIKTQQTKGK